MRYALLVFDWDGTLIDSAGAIVCVHPVGLPRSRAAGARRRPREPRHRPGTAGRAGLRDPGLPPGDYGPHGRALPHPFPRARRGDPVVSGDGSDARRPSRLAATCSPSPPARAAPASRGRWTIRACRPLFAASRCADQCAPKPAPDMLLELMAGARHERGEYAHDRRHGARSADGGTRRRAGRRGELRRARQGATWPRARRSPAWTASAS